MLRSKETLFSEMSRATPLLVGSDWNFQKLDFSLARIAPYERDIVRRGIRWNGEAGKRSVLVDIELSGQITRAFPSTGV
jgi:hypothetical protein